MSIKVKAFEIIIKETTLEIPDKCPNCGASFCTGFNLIERAYVPTLAGADIVNGEIEFRGSASVDHDADLVTGYECALCETCVVQATVTEL